MPPIRAFDCEYAISRDRDLAHGVAELQHTGYRLFDAQHAVLPTKLPLEEFYQQLVTTQQVLNKKHLGWAALCETLSLATKLVMQGQTNFLRMLWKFNSVYNVERQVSDHAQLVKYQIRQPEHQAQSKVDPATLLVHPRELLKPLRTM